MDGDKVVAVMRAAIALAERDPVEVDDRGAWCALCSAVVDIPYRGVIQLDDHDKDCPWRMAKEACDA